MKVLTVCPTVTINTGMNYMSAFRTGEEIVTFIDFLQILKSPSVPN